MKILSAKWKFFSLHAATIVMVWLSLAFWDYGLAYLYVVALVSGIVLMVKGVRNCTRRGIGRERATVVLVLSAAGLTLAWVIVLAVLAIVASIPSLGIGFLGLWAPGFAVLSAGSMASLGLGPFRGRG